MSMGKVVWCNRGWQPVSFGYCPSKRAWNREMKRMGLSEPYPDTDAKTTFFTRNGKSICIVTLNEKAAAEHTDIVVSGLMVHEATHIWQEVKIAMREPEPSAEFEAYSMQAIFQELMWAREDTRK